MKDSQPLVSAAVPYAPATARSRIVGLLAIGLAVIAGCTPDEVHRDLPPAKVGVVTAYGQTLDASATPEQVVYVLLRSIREDVEAAQAHNREAQKKAMHLTHSLGAFTIIERRLVEALNLVNKSSKRDLGEQRDQQLFDFTRFWAPIAGYYIASFEQDFEAAKARMRVGAQSNDTVHVFYHAEHDPAATDPAARQPVILDIELVREPADGASYWRVARVGYAGRPGARTRPAATSTATAG